MRRTLSALLLVLALAGAAMGQKKAIPLKVEGDTVVVVRSFPCKVVAEPGADLYVWRVPPGVKATDDENTLTITAAPEGVHSVTVQTVTTNFELIDGKVKKTVIKDRGVIDVAVGKVPGPTPPGPDPDPKPPDPKPPEPQPKDDAPFAAPGLAVLIVYESAELAKLPRGQQNCLYAKSVRDALRSACFKDDGNKNGAWRVWDKDDDPKDESKMWQDAMKVERKSVPWVVISNGKTGYSGPLPDAPEKMIDLIEKYKPKGRK